MDNSFHGPHLLSTEEVLLGVLISEGVFRAAGKTAYAFGIVGCGGGGGAGDSGAASGSTPLLERVLSLQ